MDMDKSMVFLSGSILIMLGFIVIVAGSIVINNLLHKYWKPIRIFTADSWQSVGGAPLPRYATEEELAKIAPEFNETKGKK